MKSPAQRRAFSYLSLPGGALFCPHGSGTDETIFK